MYSTTTQRSDRLRSWKASKVLWHLPQINPRPINANHPHNFTSAKPTSQVDFHQSHLNEGGAVVETVLRVCLTTILRGNPLTISYVYISSNQPLGQTKCLFLVPLIFGSLSHDRKFRKSSMSSLKHAVAPGQGASQTLMKQDELFGAYQIIHISRTCEPE